MPAQACPPRVPAERVSQALTRSPGVGFRSLPPADGEAAAAQQAQGRAGQGSEPHRPKDALSVRAWALRRHDPKRKGDTDPEVQPLGSWGLGPVARATGV